jgi:membrane protein implicated in regulation of membrane protease activity
MNALWWLVAALILLVVEMVTPGLFFFACLAAGALAAAVAAWAGAGAWACWGTFFGSSTLLVLIVAPLARRWMKRIPESPVGLSALAGQRARVTHGIHPDSGEGQVRLASGALWRAAADLPIPAETWVEVLEVVGTRLRVRPLPDPSTPKE